MDNTLPRGQSILSYQDFFNLEPPGDPLSLLKGMCKVTLLGEFSALNYVLKPKTTMYYDTSLKTQWKLLHYFSGSDEQLFLKLRTLYSARVLNSKSYPLIFTRQTCLFACEQIVNSDLNEVEEFTLEKSWLKLFQYILAVNSEITKQTNVVPDNPQSLEELNPQMLPLNELSIECNPLYTPFRGYHLLRFFAEHPELGQPFAEYFSSTYDVPYDHFVYELMSIYYANNMDGVNNLTNPLTGEDIDTSFFYSVKESERSLFDALSESFENEKTERLITIKKYPFYRSANHKYLLIDNILLLDKSYSQFINDFWFDCVRNLKNAQGKNLIDIRKYRSEIGVFLESYVGMILDHSFGHSKDKVIKLFDELKIKSGNNEIEITDVYLRYKKQVFIAEVKSTGLYDEEKYSGDINQLYKNERENFFASFGVDQIVRCISSLKVEVPQIDPDFPSDSRCHIFPAIIVNEKAMQTPFMAEIFNARFKELMVDVQADNLVIYPLSVIHVSDLEHMEDYLHLRPMEFWNLLRFHLRFPAFIPPFYNTLNIKDVRPNFAKVMELFEKLIGKYHIPSENK